MALAIALRNFWRSRQPTGRKPSASAVARPTNLIYGVDDRPPGIVVAISAFQHVVTIGSVGVIFPLLVLQAAAAPPAMIVRVISVSMLALGLATLMLCWRSRQFGCGYLVPSVFTAAYLPASLIAAQEGGWPLVCGMTMFGGAFEMLLSRFVHRLRPYLPTEIAGFAVLMIGLTLGILGFNLITGVSAAGEAMGPNVETQAVLGTICVVVMIVLNIWGAKSLRLFSVLVGLILGYILALLGGFVDFSGTHSWLETMISLPLPVVSWPRISPDLLVSFAIGAIACALRAMGDIATAQKANDAQWQRPDMESIRGGLMADGLGTVVAGLLGTVGVNTFSGSIGLSIATGVTSRIVGLGTGLLFIAVSLVPPWSSLLALMPRPLMGAALIFTACFILLSGMQVITSRLMDARRTVVIGAGLLLGFSRYLFPAFYAAAPGYLQPALSSPLVIGLLTALGLNLVFRIGVKKTAEMTYVPADGLDVLEAFALEQGGVWGARREVMERVANAMIECAECLELVMKPDTAARFALTFDEYQLNLVLRYEGKRFVIEGAAPSAVELIADDTMLTRLSVLMIGRLANRLGATSNGEAQRVTVSFDH